MIDTEHKPLLDRAMASDLLYRIGISMIPGVGPINAKKLISYCSGVEAVFHEKRAALVKIPGIGEVVAKAVMSQKVLGEAEAEIEFITRNQIHPLFYLDSTFPKRLLYCEDGPIMLYYKGNANFENPKIVSVVGTRSASSYGKDVCQKLVEGLKEHNALVVSGLAYGIDICAHKEALKNGLQTVGVMAHGLNRIYPGSHRKTAEEMLDCGALLTEFIHTTQPDRENFPKRNRVVAGISDATIVIESGLKGGSMITADIANSYNRDVFAVPGKVNDPAAQGCHFLIKTSRAALLESIKDLEYTMGWTREAAAMPAQSSLFIELEPDENLLVDILRQRGDTGIDELSLQSKFAMSRTSALLLNLEFKGVVNTKPGKVYSLA